ncbi:hypothetical protein C5Y96_00925 [Blastopirellula marina]|uniref:Protein kinase domain-containing protein n=1 Tax=Blastopirellula marina TaxID=124 RepID=A0A2S8G9B5_9BACT|nr:MULTISPECIES: hypothetical protein [Pirellulaceae]PQO41017.1 hypothetical protein C5Y96_00925 [Blastopirellula marina]RCS56233.1 hypothetical protein DTL36_00925 [Bremerella cremea]
MERTFRPPTNFRLTSLSPEEQEEIDQLCEEFQNAWDPVHPPRLTWFLERYAGQAREVLIDELLLAEFYHRKKELLECQCAVEFVLDQYPEAKLEILASMHRIAHHKPDGLPGDIVKQLLDPFHVISPTLNNFPYKEGRDCNPHLISYIAHEKTASREVIVSILHHRNELTIKHVAAKARILKTIKHAALAEIIAIEICCNSVIVIQESVADSTLASAYSHHSEEATKASFLIECIARALHLLHSRHIFHGNIGPKSISIEESTEQPYLLDCLSLRAFQATELQSMGSTFELSGDLTCPPTTACHGLRNDIHALGATLYWLLAERRSGGDALSRLMNNPRIDRELVRQVSEDLTVPPGLQNICLRATGNDPEVEYESAEKLADALHAWRNSTVPPQRHSMVWMSAIAVSFALLFALVIPFVLMTSEDAPSMPQNMSHRRLTDASLPALLGTDNNLKNLLAREGIETASISGEDFHVTIKVINPFLAPSPFQSRLRDGDLAIAEIEISDRLRDFAHTLEFRVENRPWRRPYIQGSGTNTRYWVPLSERDIKTDADLFVRLDSNSSLHNEGFVVGPFEYKTNLLSQVRSIQSDFLEQAKMTLINSNWIEKHSGTNWFLVRGSAIRERASVIHEFRVGTSKDDLVNIAPLRPLSRQGEFYERPQDNDFSDAFGRLIYTKLESFSATDELFVQVVFVDGMQTEIRRFASTPK